ncbi:MAG: hypothetical protein HQ546_05370 [Planctomycetes bacterium]|nr:hypothetical protein [Planctomycetota bacterium]
MTSGFIVNEEMGGGPAVLVERSAFWKDIPAGGVLLNDTREAAVFPTRKAARAAIRRTMAWWHAQGRHQNWPDDAYAIRRLVANAKLTLRSEAERNGGSVQ